MSKVLFLPIVDSEQQLNDIVSRAAWFLSHFEIDEFLIPVSTASLKEVDWTVPESMDQSISQYFNQLRQKTRIQSAVNAEWIHNALDQSDIILEWNSEQSGLLTPALKAEIKRVNKKFWSVDPLRTRMEGSFYIEAGLHLVKDKKCLIEENRRKFHAIASQLGTFDSAYVMATGPSVARYKLYDYTNSLAVVCNSVILDEDLMSTVKPRFLVFADPIFHFGPSQYAAGFRRALRLAANRYDFTIIIPFKYYSLLVSVEPELRARIIAIPFAKERDFNFDLRNDFEVKTTANILTLLMIPLAATFARRVSILGCDGRPIEKDDYFWSHNQKTQINDKMANIKEVHPGFFAIDYNDYYLDHCSTLEEQLALGESIKKRFESLGYSYIPALQRRMMIGRRKKPCPLSPAAVALIVDPDAKSWSGHYMAYNEKLSVQLESLGMAVKVLCRSDLDRDIISSRTNYFPTFTRHSWQIGNPKASPAHAVKFEEELVAGIERAVGSYKGQVLLYMYCGGVEHAEILKRVARRFQAVRVNINLFWLSFRLTQAYAELWRPFLEEVDMEAGAGRFVATAPTEEIRNRLAQLTGVILPVAPHPSTGISDVQFNSLNHSQSYTSSVKRLRVLFPSAPRAEKGYDVSLKTVELLSENDQFVPCIRHNPTFSTPDVFADIGAKPEKAELIVGELNDSEFRELFLKCDIVVLPYTPDAFAERTSGLLIDALYCHLPCVVIRGTWLGNLVERYGCGVVVDDLHPEALYEGIRKLAADYSVFRSRTAEAAADYFSRNSWQTFAEFLKHGYIADTQRIKGDRQSQPLIGPYERESSAHWDETNAIAKLFANILTGSTMIDVGAHHGSALMPFLNLGWTIYAFEPDVNNRERLIQRLASHGRREHVALDSRCVGEASANGVSFYTSEQSTGISGLSAFHETHSETQTVDVVSLAEFLSDKDLDQIDFLKIDTEGHDLFVLKGFPWNRFKPAVIECEFEDSKTLPLGYTFSDLAEFLQMRGYRVYVSEWHPIIRYGIQHEWCQLKRFPCRLNDCSGWGNLIAFWDSVDEEEVIAAVQGALKINREPRDKNGLSAKRDRKRRWVGQPAMMIVEHSPEWFFDLNAGWNFCGSGGIRQLWMASITENAFSGKPEYVSTIDITVDQPVALRVTLGRHGRSAFEGCARTVELSPNVSKTVVMCHKFQRKHDRIKLQIEVIQSFGQTQREVKFRFGRLGIAESLRSVVSGVQAEEIRLRYANDLFRKKKFSKALGIYLLLTKNPQVPNCRVNAVIAARRAGFAWVDKFSALCWIWQGNPPEN